MKTNTFLTIIILSGLAAMALGASVAVAFTVSVTAAILGMACNDYTRQRMPVRFGPTT